RSCVEVHSKVPELSARNIRNITKIAALYAGFKSVGKILPIWLDNMSALPILIYHLPRPALSIARATRQSSAWACAQFESHVAETRGPNSTYVPTLEPPLLIGDDSAPLPCSV